MTYIRRARWLGEALPQSTGTERGRGASPGDTALCMGTGFGFLVLTFDTRFTCFLLSLVRLL